MRSHNANPNNKKTDADEILDLFGLPKDLFLGMPLLSMAGNRSLCVSNHRGIRQYSSEMIVIAAKPFSIQITGRNLCIPDFSKDQVEITGYMEGISFIP